MSNENEFPPVKMVFLKNGMPALNDEDVPRGTFLGLPMRGTSDMLSYGVGLAYMFGLSYGAVFGLFRGIQKAPTSHIRVVWTSILNQTTRYGPWAGNALAFGYGAFDGLYEGIREKNDYYNHVAAAFSSGAFFKSTAGIRPALLAGGLLSSAVIAYGGLEKYFNKDFAVKSTAEQ